MKQAGIKVLIVDDEVALANTLAQRLKMRDLQVQIAYNGEEALSRLTLEEPDVMVLDLRMPGMDGMDVLKEVKKTHPHIQVIILTGHGTDKEEEEAKILGGFCFLKKPAEIETLAAKIKGAFSEKCAKTP